MQTLQRLEGCMLTTNALAHWAAVHTSSMRLLALGHGSRLAWIALAAGTAAWDRG